MDLPPLPKALKIGAVIAIIAFILIGFASSISRHSRDEDFNSSGEGIENEVESDKTENYKVGDKVSINDYLIVFADHYDITVVNNAHSKHNGEQVVKLPVTWTNNSNKSSSFPTYGLYVYNPAGVETSSSIGALFADSSIKAPNIMPEVTQETFLYFTYTGDGRYTIEIDNHNYGQPNAIIEVEIGAANSSASPATEPAPSTQQNQITRESPANVQPDNDSQAADTTAVPQHVQVPQPCIYRQLYGNRSPSELANEEPVVVSARDQLEEAQRLQRQYENSTSPEYVQKRYAAEFATNKAQALYDDAYSAALSRYQTMLNQCS